MKKQYLQLIITFCSIVVAIASIIRCQEKEAAAPPAEIIEAAEEANRQVIEQGPVPQMKTTAEMMAEEPMDSAQQAYFERQYFEALVKIASQKAFTHFDDYLKFIADNPQFPRSHYSYDAGGKPFNIAFKTSPDKEGWEIRNHPVR